VLRWLDTVLSLWKSGLDVKPVHVRFVVESVALGQVFLQIPQFPLLSMPFCHCFILICSSGISFI